MGKFVCMRSGANKVFFSLFLRVGRYVAVLEYAHLTVRLDLKEAIGKVCEACENIQRTAEHVRRKVEGMDVHEMMIVRFICQGNV